MAGILTLKELQEAVRAGEIDTVVACFPDMQGRLVGKRFQGPPMGEMIKKRQADILAAEKAVGEV